MPIYVLFGGAFLHYYPVLVGRINWRETKSDFESQHSRSTHSWVGGECYFFFIMPFKVLGFGQAQAMGTPSVIDLKVSRLPRGGEGYRKSDLGGFLPSRA